MILALAVAAGGVFLLVANHRPPTPARQPSSGPSLPTPATPASLRREPRTASKDLPWTNSLQMKFVPVPVTGGPTDAKQLLFSIWETRKGDWRQFAADPAAYAAAGTAVDGSWRSIRWKGEPVSPTDDHPVINVSWDGAVKFCAWLTAKERNAGMLGPHDEYRLPSDHEWSCAVGIGKLEDARQSPQQKHAQIKDLYPWGTGLPPRGKAGNYADATFKRKAPEFGALKNYDDGYVTTAPVGQFDVNPLGLFDLGGNVWEWCSDNYDGSSAPDHPRVLRGGAWRGEDPAYLLSSARAFDAPAGRRSNHGFRAVLALGN